MSRKLRLIKGGKKDEDEDAAGREAADALCKTVINLLPTEHLRDELKRELHSAFRNPVRSIISFRRGVEISELTGGVSRHDFTVGFLAGVSFVAGIIGKRGGKALLRYLEMRGFYDD